MGSPRTLDARASVAWLRRFARTTPGVVGLIAVVVAAFCVIAGVVVGGQLDGRIAERDAVLDRSEPFAYAAQNLYAAPSAADAAAASAYLSGIETPPHAGAVSASPGRRGIGAGRRDRGGHRRQHPQRRWRRFRRNWLPTRGWSSRRGPTTGRDSPSGPRTCGRRRR